MFAFRRYFFFLLCKVHGFLTCISKVHNDWIIKSRNIIFLHDKRRIELRFIRAPSELIAFNFSVTHSSFKHYMYDKIQPAAARTRKYINLWESNRKYGSRPLFIFPRERFRARPIFWSRLSCNLTNSWRFVKNKFAHKSVRGAQRTAAYGGFYPSRPD